MGKDDVSIRKSDRDGVGKETSALLPVSYQKVWKWKLCGWLRAKACSNLLCPYIYPVGSNHVLSRIGNKIAITGWHGSYESTSRTTQLVVGGTRALVKDTTASKRRKQVLRVEAAIIWCLRDCFLSSHNTRESPENGFRKRFASGKSYRLHNRNVKLHSNNPIQWAEDIT